MAIEQIRSKLTQSVIMSLTSFVSGFSYVALMFTYDTTLALYATGLVLGLSLAWSRSESCWPDASTSNRSPRASSTRLPST